MSSGQVIPMRVKTVPIIFKLHEVDTITGCQRVFGLLYTTPLWIMTEQPTREESTSQRQCRSRTDPYGRFWQPSYSPPWCTNLILSLLANQKSDLITSQETAGWILCASKEWINFGVGRCWFCGSWWKQMWEEVMLFFWLDPKVKSRLQQGCTSFVRGWIWLLAGLI